MPVIPALLRLMQKDSGLHRKIYGGRKREREEREREREREKEAKLR
jgi:hypothetical protein